MSTTGLLVFVLRSKTDCTNGGISSKHDQFVLTGPGIEGPFIPDARAPELRLVRRDIGGEYLSCEPVARPAGKVGPMFGGNFIHTSDSRFPSKYPIPVHDRFDTQADYDSLTR